MDFLRSWVGTLKGVGPKNVIIVGLVRSPLRMYFLSMHHMIPRDKIFLDYTRQILTLEAIEAFNHCSIFDKAAFCLGEKQGMLINDECSSWFNRVQNFLMSVGDRREEILYGNELVGKVNQNNPTPECEVNGTDDG